MEFVGCHVTRATSELMLYEFECNDSINVEINQLSTPPYLRVSENTESTLQCNNCCNIEVDFYGGAGNKGMEAATTRRDFSYRQC